MRRGALLSLCAVAVLGLILSCSTSREVDLSEIESKAEIPTVEGPRISVDQLKAILGKPEVVVIDLRIDKHWNESEVKIAGAIRKDPEKVDAWKQEIGQDKRVVTYCA